MKYVIIIIIRDNNNNNNRNCSFVYKQKKDLTRHDVCYNQHYL